MTDQIVIRIVAVLIGYLLGNFTTGYFLGKANNVDIQKEGSGGVGMTNTMRTLGKKAGIITFIVDYLKCVVAMFIVYFIFRNHVDYIGIYMIYAGIGTILGHNFPVFLKFKGGKGIACSAGLVSIMFPKIFAIALAIFLLIALTTKYVSLGSIMGSITYGVCVVLFGQMGWLRIDFFPWLSFPDEYLIEIYIVMLFATALAIFQHRSNIVRLINHNENKLSFGSGKKKSVD